MTHAIARPSACLDPETLGALAEGRLAGAERDAAVRHLASCRRCHEIFASSVQILEAEGALPAVKEAAPTVVTRRPTLAVWLSAVAAALVAAVVLLPRAPVDRDPRVAQASPTPVAIVTPVATATPTPAPVQGAALPPEAIAALRTLGGFESPYAAPPSVGFTPDERGRAVARGIADVDAAARALRNGTPLPEATGPVDDWRKVGRVLEASRLALLDDRRPEPFFATPWARAELAGAARALRDAGVPDAAWPGDAVGTPRDAGSARKLLDRLDALLEELS
jgi:hypothetical protein